MKELNSVPLATVVLVGLLGFGPAVNAHGNHARGDHWHGELTSANHRGAESEASRSVKLIQTTAETMADGEVRKLDAEGRKITLKHGEIKSVDMPPMTMVFQVKDAGVFGKAKVGDKVKFKVVKEGNTYFVTELQPVQ